MDMTKVFSDENLSYYIHGTGRHGDDLDNKITGSIFEDGLRLYSGADGFSASSLDLTATAYPIGVGSPDLYQKTGYDALNNNQHLESKRVIVVALPKEYIFPNNYCFGEMREASFTEEKVSLLPQEEKDVYLENGLDMPTRGYLMPEFVVGAYDAINKAFIPNYNYFKTLNKEDREALFQKVHTNYINYLKDQIKQTTLNGVAPFSVDDYLALFNGDSDKSPLSKQEIEELRAFSQEVLREKEEQKKEQEEKEASVAQTEEEMWEWEMM